jgi:hypothetical protein
MILEEKLQTFEDKNSIMYGEKRFSEGGRHAV